MAQTIRQYQIVGKLGSGGMGVVYKALDETLGRFVALKFLPLHGDLGQDRVLQDRLIQEARAASAIDHPNIGIVHEVGHAEDGQTFIAMAYYEGQTIKEQLTRGEVPLRETISIVRQIALGLCAAHSHAIVHRDIKPANVIITNDGVAKIIDFGIAKLSGVTHLSHPGSAVGTPAYMSPEQARGEQTDHRTDLWSLTVVLYELLTGRLPFRGSHDSAIVHAILHDTPPRVRALKPQVPPLLERLAAKGLEKNPDRRHQDASEFLRELDEVAATTSPTSAPRPRRLAWAVAFVATILSASVVAVTVRQNARVRWAREVALPRIQDLIGDGDNVAAFALATEADRYLSSDPVLRDAWFELSGLVSVESTPSGAEVYMQPYTSVDGPWTHLGATPLKDVRVPRTYFRWKVERPGHVPLEFGRGLTAVGATAIEVVLDTDGSAPPDMVRLPGGTWIPTVSGLDHLPSQAVGTFWIDSHEVTNSAYKAFMDAGGYTRREFWAGPFISDGREVAWEAAIERFRDATGRLGPATWELGTYPKGQDDYPVTGVSWYEAAAFAKFSGKVLPSVYHWSRAAGTAGPGPSFVVAVSNIESRGNGPLPVTFRRGLSPFGASSMAGNVKEWCLNEGRNETRYILGGAWNEPAYMFIDTDAQSPWSREATYGFRCVQEGDEKATSAVTGQFLAAFRDYNAERPVSDTTFQNFRRMFSYDNVPLRPSVSTIDTSPEEWRRETVTFDAAYGSERVTAYLYLPVKGSPPYQTVIYFPGSSAIQERDFEKSNLGSFDFVMKSGRAVMFPVYKGTFNRGSDLSTDVPAETNLYRDHVVAWVKDLNRTIDYLETRDDIDRSRIGFYGNRWGGSVTQLPALETRIRANVLVGSGYYFAKAFPEVDQINFVPRVRAPTLVVNGNADFFCPVQTCLVPFYRLLGPQEPSKRLVITDSGHVVPRNQLIKESLDWFDRHLGPVE